MEEELQFIPTWCNTYKTKADAFQHIFEGFVTSPGCAGLDGKLSIMFGGNFVTIVPKKKKTTYD